MKKPRYLDRDGLDGILPSLSRAQAKADSPTAKSDKTQTKPVRGKVAWLLTGLGALLAGGVLYQVSMESPQSVATPVAANSPSSAPASASLSQPTIPSAALARSEPASAGAVQPPEPPRLEALASAEPEQASIETPTSDRQAPISETLAELPTEPTAAGLPKSPDSPAEPASTQALFTVRFKFDSSKLAPMSRTESTELRDAAKACQGRLSLIGHTCNLGPDASNVQLGLARANALKKWLVGQGIVAQRIVTASEGMRKPAAANDTKAGQSLNRRVELYCLDQ